MPAGAKYLFIVSMDVAPEHEALFNEVYDTEHIPSLLEVPGVRHVYRLKGEPFSGRDRRRGEGAAGAEPGLQRRLRDRLARRC